jgi:3-deoxy-D-manno-octulosonate 8-phosphate phosphatase (KDO 8-P phosphatase)
MSDLEDRLRRIRFIVCDVDGVLTDGSIPFDADGKPWRTFHVRDVTAFTFWRLAGGYSALVSGLGSKAVESLSDTWALTEVHQWVRDKATVIRDMAARHGIPLEEVAFLGDDLIDVRAMKIVGLAVAVADAAPEAREAAHWITDSAGGRGALREVVQRVLEAQGRLEEILDIYASRKNLIQ